MEVIDRIALVDSIYDTVVGSNKPTTQMIEDAMNCIKDAPVINVIEVVHCSDCIHASASHRCCNLYPELPISPDFYCRDGNDGT